MKPCLLALLSLPLSTAIVTPALAESAPPFSIEAASGAVTILARGLEADAHAVARAHGDRIEVGLAKSASATQFVQHESPDATVSRVELIPGEWPHISIKVHHSKRTTELLAEATRIERSETGCRIVIPREPMRTAVPVKASAAAAPVKASAVAAPVKATAVAPSAVLAAVVDESVGATSSVAAAASMTHPMSQIDEGALPKSAIAPAAETTALGTASAELSTGRIALVCGILAVCAVLALLAKRRRAPASAIENIRILGTRTLGAKSKVVLVSAGNREMLLAVSDKGVRLIDRWKAESQISVDGSAEEAEQPAAARAAASAPVALKAVPSPAVAGILKLRRAEWPVADDLATGDLEADEEWARAILAATHGKRFTGDDVPAWAEEERQSSALRSIGGAG